MPESKFSFAPEPVSRPAFTGPEISIELAPSQVVGFLPPGDALPRGSRVFLTHLEGKPLSLQVGAASQLLDSGFTPVPHVGARHFASGKEFRDLVQAHSRNGVKEVLFVGGNPVAAKGPFDDAAALLSDPVLADSTISTAFLGGYPEGHPAIPQNALRVALEDKIAICRDQGLEPRLITQFAFDGTAIANWAADIRQRYPDLPIHIGLAGVTSLTKLIRFAMLCGVGPSLSMLRRSGTGLFNILADKDPGDVLDAIEAHPTLGSLHLHFYPFGGWEKTLAWIAERRASVAARAINKRGERQ